MSKVIIPWYHNFITISKAKIYTAWDETQSNQIGTYLTYAEAVAAIKEYAKTLDPPEEQDEKDL